MATNTLTHHDGTVIEKKIKKEYDGTTTLLARKQTKPDGTVIEKIYKQSAPGYSDLSSRRETRSDGTFIEEEYYGLTGIEKMLYGDVIGSRTEMRPDGKFIENQYSYKWGELSEDICTTTWPNGAVMVEKSRNGKPSTASVKTYPDKGIVITKWWNDGSKGEAGGCCVKFPDGKKAEYYTDEKRDGWARTYETDGMVVSYTKKNGLRQGLTRTTRGDKLLSVALYADNVLDVQKTAKLNKDLLWMQRVDSVMDMLRLRPKRCAGQAAKDQLAALQSKHALSAD